MSTAPALNSSEYELVNITLITHLEVNNAAGWSEKGIVNTASHDNLIAVLAGGNSRDTRSSMVAN